MAVDNPTVVQEASTASHEWKNVNSQVSALLASILQRVQKGQVQDAEQEEEESQGKPKAKDKPRSVEIQIGKHKVFKGIEGQEPQKNTLTPAQVSALEKLVNTPSTEPGQDLDSSVQNLGRVVTVKVDKEPVLRVANGQLDNKLAPEPQQERTPETQPEAFAQPQKERAVPEFAIQQEAVAQPEPEKLTEALDQSVDTSKLEYSKLLLDATNRVPDYFDNEFTPEFVQNTLNNSGHQISGQTFGESIDRWVLTEAISQGIPKEKATNLVLEQSPYVQRISEYTEPKDFLRDYKSLDGYKESLNKEAEHILEKHLSAPKVTEPEQQPEPEVQTVLETLEPLGHHQPLGHQEQGKPSLIDLAQQLEDTLSEVQPQAKLVSEEQQPEPETTEEAKAPHQEYATEPTSEPVIEPPISEAQTKVEEPELESEPEPEAITTESQTETEQQPEPQPKRSLGETLAKDFANSFDLPPETKEYFKETGAAIKEGAKAAWAKLKVKVKETAIAGVHQAKTQLHSRQAANTAVQLLNSDPQGRAFKGEDYNITAVNRHTISVTDAEQNEILRFEETPLGPKILKSELTPKQLKEFAQVRGQIQKHGTENLLNTQSSARMQFLQGFAPQGDRAVVQKIHNDNTISRIENIANTLKPTATARNSETHELGDYSIERKGDNLQVTHKDRGVILSRTNGQVQGNLSNSDIAHFKGVNNRVSTMIGAEPQQIPVAAVAAPAPTPTKTTKPSSTDIEMGD